MLVTMHGLKLFWQCAQDVFSSNEITESFCDRHVLRYNWQMLSAGLSHAYSISQCHTLETEPWSLIHYGSESLPLPRSVNRYFQLFSRLSNQCYLRKTLYHNAGRVLCIQDSWRVDQANASLYQYLCIIEITYSQRKYNITLNNIPED